MTKLLKQAFLSPSGIAIYLAVLGFLSALVTMFVDITATVSIKWILFIIFISSSTIVALLKSLNELFYNRKMTVSSYEVPIKALTDKNILIIRNNPNFTYNILVGCYSITEEIESLYSVGLVYHVQEKLTQVKVLFSCQDDKDDNNELSNMSLNSIVVRPVVPYSALSNYNGEGV